MGFFEERAKLLLEAADIKIGGERPWDIAVHDERLYRRVLFGGSLALGEAYVDGWWDCPSLDEFFARLFRTGVVSQAASGPRAAFRRFIGRCLNLQSTRRAYQVGKEHYDIGNDLYERMLDPRMVYTCAYWKDATDLATAQEAKLDLIARKIGLEADHRVLDIGCGWGSFAKFAAERYGAEVVGITVSEEQAALARKRVEGLPVEIRVEDYRTTRGTFDRIVSIGMFEHVGHKNYRTYMEAAARLLSENGLFLLHTIGGNRSAYRTDPWIERYIFPNGMLPSISQIGRSLEDLFIMEDWHNFGSDYDRTLMAWHANFRAAWPELSGRYSERFRRMWEYYLLACAGSFRARHNQLWQIVLSKRGIKGGYASLR